MWQLNPSITFEWYSDLGEYLLYSPEVSETLLLSENSYQTLQTMKNNSQLLLTTKGLQKILAKTPIEAINDLEKQIDELMEVLQKKQMVRRIKN